jgi:hypothetical protein
VSRLLKKSKKKAQKLSSFKRVSTFSIGVGLTTDDILALGMSLQSWSGFSPGITSVFLAVVCLAQIASYHNGVPIPMLDKLQSVKCYRSYITNSQHTKAFAALVAIAAIDIL